MPGCLPEMDGAQSYDCPRHLLLQLKKPSIPYHTEVKTMNRVALAMPVAAILALTLLLHAGSGAAAANDQTAVTNTKHAEHLVQATNFWIRVYGQLPAPLREILEPLAEGLATVRRPALSQLINDAPDIALSNRLGKADRVNLPDSVTGLLETQIDTKGDLLNVQYGRTFDGQVSSYVDQSNRVLRLPDQRIVDPSVYGRRADQPSKEALPVHGILLDEQFAWSEDPYRLLDSVEATENQVPEDAIGLFAGDDLVIVPTSEDLENFIAFLVARESFLGPLLIDPAGDEDEDIASDMAWTNGPKDVLWLPIDFDEMPGSRFTASADTDYIIDQSKQWLDAISRGRTGFEVTYFPGILRLGPGSLTRANNELAFPTFPAIIIDDTIAALATYDRDNGGTGRWLASSWDRIAIVVSDSLTAATGDIARGAFSTQSKYMVFHGLIPRFFMQHELGHTFYFGHPWFSRPLTSDPAGPGLVQPMTWSFMGQAFGDQRAHPASAYKFNAYWIDDFEVLDASAGGTFRLVSHDEGPNGFARALRISTADSREYWVDMRRLWTEVTRLHEGVQVYHRDSSLPFTRTGGDLTYVGPAITVLPQDSPLRVGDAFEDVTRGVRIRLDAVGTDPFIAGALFADVTVELF